ncbi:MAG: hypothetical protein WKF84_19500 [Pyrinomonadaceae bacterium]
MRIATRRGLEVSAIAILDVARQTAYPLSAQQTPARPPRPSSRCSPPRRRRRQQLHARNLRRAETTRIDFYLQHLAETVPYLPPQVCYGVFDGAFAKHKFVSGVRALDLHLDQPATCGCQLALSLHGRSKEAWAGESL